MSPIAIILIVVLLVVVLGGGWGYRSGYYATTPGYGYGIVGLVIFVLLILLLMGRI